MASIVSSTFVLGHAQTNGQTYVTETHTWDGGLQPTVIEYGPVPAGVNHQAIANARAVKIMAHMAVVEAEAFFRGALAAPLALVHQAPATLAARFWDRLQELHRKGQKDKFELMVWILYNHVQAGSFTSNDVRLSFNTAYGRSLNSAQWTSFVGGTLAPIRDRYQAQLDQADL